MKHNNIDESNYALLFFGIECLLLFSLLFLFPPMEDTMKYNNKCKNSCYENSCGGNCYNDTIDNNDKAIMKTYTVGGNGDIDYYTPGPKYIYGVGYTVKPGPAAVQDHIYGDD